VGELAHGGDQAVDERACPDDRPQELRPYFWSL